MLIRVACGEPRLESLCNSFRKQGFRSFSLERRPPASWRTEKLTNSHEGRADAYAAGLRRRSSGKGQYVQNRLPWVHGAHEQVPPAISARGELSGAASSSRSVTCRVEALPRFDASCKASYSPGESLRSATLV
jgi:hypothetical protein